MSETSVSGKGGKRADDNQPTHLRSKCNEGRGPFRYMPVVFVENRYWHSSSGWRPGNDAGRGGDRVLPGVAMIAVWCGVLRVGYGESGSGFGVVCDSRESGVPG